MNGTRNVFNRLRARKSSLINRLVTVLFLMLLLGSTNTRFTGQFLAQTSTWTPRASMPTALHQISGAVVNDILYIPGGEHADSTGSTVFAALQAYDPATDTWTMKAPMPTARRSYCLGVIDGIIFVVGGNGDTGFVDTVEAYDTTTDIWTTKAPLPRALSGSGAGVINGTLYVVGGLLDGNGPVDTLYAYDPQTNHWSTKSAMAIGRNTPAVGVINGILYAMGGNSVANSYQEASVEAYDPATNMWISKAPMLTGRYNAAAVTLNGHLYVLGGYGDNICCNRLSEVEAYDPATNTWSTKAFLSQPLEGLAAGAINGIIYVAGGHNGIASQARTEAFVENQICTPRPSGLVSWWDADSVSGTNASDISDGNGGTMLGGISSSPGMVGSAFGFDGSTGRVHVGNPTSLNFGTNGPVSLEAWFKWDGSGSYVNNIIRKSNYPVFGPGAGYWLRIGRDSQTMEFFAGETTGAVGYARGVVTTPVTPGVWHHVAGTRDSSGTMNLYLDGELKGTTQAPNANTTSEAPFVLGAWDDRFGVIEFFSGLIDEISVYNRALDASEVQTIFNSGSMGKCKGTGNSSPIAACNNVIVAAGPDCTASASIDNGSVDPNGDPITITQSPPGPYPLGSTSVTLTVTDSHGASSQCTATVTVVDNTPPAIACPPNIVIDNSNSLGQCSAVVNYSVTATDNCAGVTVACSPPSGSGFPKGATGVTCSATDLGGNTSSCSFTVTVSPPQLSALSPAMVWIGLKNSDDVGTKFDLLAEVFRNGTPIAAGQIDNVPGGSSGFNNAVSRTINLAVSTLVDICPGDALSLRLSVRIAAASGHRAGTARLWFNDADANSRFGSTIGGVTKDYYLAAGLSLSFTPGPGPKNTVDVFVDRAVGGNPFKPFGTWSITF